MPKVRLTDRFISGVKSDGSQTDYFDEVTTGLFLRVSANRKAWGLLFTRPSDGKRARITFATYPEQSLASARAQAIELKGGVSEGSDASAAVRRIKTGIGADDMTVKQLAALYIADRRQRGRRTVDDMDREMKLDVIPVIGQLAVAKLKRADLARVTDGIKARGSAIQANRTASLLKAMTAWAVDNGHLEQDPGHRWKPPSEARPARERTFTAAEIQQLWAAMEQAGMSRWTIECLRFCLATGCRQGEAAGMLRQEVDLDQGLWTIPAERSKNGRAHTLPLSTIAVELLKPVLEGHKLPAVFPGPRGTPLKNSAIARAVQRSQKVIGLAKWTSHDLRRTVATHMAELGISPFDIGLCLNHVTTTKGSVTTSVYVRYDFMKEKRAALDTWGARLAAIVAGGTADVVPINKSKKRYGVERSKRVAA